MDHTFLYESTFSPVLRIRIRIGSGFNRVPGSGFVIRIHIQAAKITHKNRKKISLIEMLDVLFLGLKDVFLKFLVIKTLDPDSLLMLDLDPNSMTPGPHYCFSQKKNR
jgi:hypothetical protein